MDETQIDVRHNLEYAMTRTVTQKDMINFLEFLRNNGYEVEPLVINKFLGIHFSSKTQSSRCMHIRPLINCRESTYVRSEDGDLCPDEIMWNRDPDVPAYHKKNKMSVVLAGIRWHQFADHETQLISRGLIENFGFLPNTIFNRKWTGDHSLDRFHQSRILTTDNDHDIDIYLGYSLNTALATWTTNMTQNERDQFKCWKCGQLHDWREFTLDIINDSFLYVLQTFVEGTFICCSSCRDELIYSKNADLCKTSLVA